MASSDAIVIGESWISEHFFTSDSTKESFLAKVKQREQIWKLQEESSESTRSRFHELMPRLAQVYGTLFETDDGIGGQRMPDPDVLVDLYRGLEQALGYSASGLTSVSTGALRLIGTQGIDALPLALLDAKAAQTPEEIIRRGARDEEAETLLLPTPIAEAGEILPLNDDAVVEYTNTARLLSELFVREQGPRFALVCAGPWVLVAERERWAEGRYLAVNLQTIVERNDRRSGGELDRGITCIDALSLAPDADGQIWWSQVLEDSVRHTVGVSSALRDGVREAIEIIANDVVSERNRTGLDPLPDSQAQELAKQSLRYLYRILFLLYAEASPELGVLPVGAPEYEAGYSIDRLRDLTLTTLTSQREQQGRHLYESLQVLFRLIDGGDAVKRPHPRPPADVAAGLTFESLQADLFRPDRTALIDEVGLTNAALQGVLERLLLTRRGNGRKAERGFISYAELGINQLGAVYEGLMSYTGFFAVEPLYEVARNADPSKGSWVVPVRRVDAMQGDEKALIEASLVRQEDINGQLLPRRYERGQFVFRLAGRERQQSASYYSPEVLTKFTVSQALAELLDQNGQTTPAREILKLHVCEPALGSGAFAIEAVRQLAEEYLKRRQVELGETIDPDQYPRELQKVKAYLALHQVYGVDLNATAIELAEISLWLDTMVTGLQAPWFGLHLRRGNSLVGARHAFYSSTTLKGRRWLKEAPEDIPLTATAAALTKDQLTTETFGRIPHFLLPAAGWGAAVEAKEGKELAEGTLKRLKAWQKQIRISPNKAQTDQLLGLGRRVEYLWQLTLRRLQLADSQARRSVDVWGAEDLPKGGAVTREQIERMLDDVNGPYRRLRTVMDAWCAMWYWPLSVSEQDWIAPPSLPQWLSALNGLLGNDYSRSRIAEREAKHGLRTLSALSWKDLDFREQEDYALSGALPVDQVLQLHPWLHVVQQVADQQGFFHWELEFASVFAKGGFDLQVGNPPWVRPDFDERMTLAEADVWWALENKSSQEILRSRRSSTLSIRAACQQYVAAAVDVTCTREFVSADSEYPLLYGLRPDLYRCFMEQTWRHEAAQGITVLIHPETHFTDEKAGLLRQETYLRLRRHWQFINELQLFEIDHHVRYGVHVYGAPLREPAFLMATALYHPSTVEASLEHDGSGPEPGFKDDDGKWDTRPHGHRILHVDAAMLQTWHTVLESDDVPVLQTRMVCAVNQAVSDVLQKLSKAPRLGELPLQFSAGWNETTDRAKGCFDVEWGRPDSWRDVILQGPHFFVATPFYKQPNPSMKHNQDWSPIDLETLPLDAIPVTAYKPRGDRATYDAAYTHWGEEHEPARAHYRVAWRNMAANTGERTLIPAIIPPGTAHVNAVMDMGGLGQDLEPIQLLNIAGLMGTLIADFFIRALNPSTIAPGLARLLPNIDKDFPLVTSIALRSARLQCLTTAYAALWKDSVIPKWASDGWAQSEGRCTERLELATPLWTRQVPLRRDVDRRQALIEIDALVALMLGVTADELCTIYRTQFAVLRGYDRDKYFYDANGRLVPQEVLKVWRKKGDAISDEERTATNAAGNTYVYELPFLTYDREADMRTAYAEFERRLAQQQE